MANVSEPHRPDHPLAGWTAGRISQNSIQTTPSNDFGGSLQWTGRLFDRHRLVLGTDARTIIGQSAEQFFSQTAFLGQTLARGQQLGWGLFGEWILPLMDRWTVTPGVRADWWKNYNANIETPVGSLAPRDNVISVVNPKLSSAYQISETLRLGASVYQAFRVPTLNELYRGFRFGGIYFCRTISSPETIDRLRRQSGRRAAAQSVAALAFSPPIGTRSRIRFYSSLKVPSQRNARTSAGRSRPAGPWTCHTSSFPCSR